MKLLNEFAKEIATVNPDAATGELTRYELAADRTWAVLQIEDCKSGLHYVIRMEKGQVVATFTTTRPDYADEQFKAQVEE